jgi:CubicO group peptidase (beta-lactamase class C family)
MEIRRRRFLQATTALAAIGGVGVTRGQAPQQPSKQQAAASAARADAASLKSEADRILNTGVDSGDVPGVVACATNREGKIYEGAFGTRTLGASAAMDADTVVWIASMTKAITGMAAMQLVEKKQLSLDDPASKVIPALAEVQVLDGWDGDAPRLRAPKRPVTLRHLLTHTAGFSYSIWNADIGRFEKVRDIPDIGTCRNAALATPLIADPGEQWNYGINIDFVGKMVEAVSGMRLGEYMTGNILAPLGMTSTGFRITPSMRARLAKVHQRGADGKLTPTDFEVPQDPEFEMGGGGLYSTAGDYLAFVRMMLNDGRVDGKQVLQPATVAEMSRNNMGDIKVAMLKTAVPPASNDAEFFPGMPKSWGLSFMINEQQAPTGRSAGSLSWAGLANTYYWIDQQKGVGGVYLTQILPFADVKSLPLFYAFEKAVYQSLP